MTLCEKILLVDALINENPEVTIRDYLETVKEIEGVSGAVVFMPKKEIVDIVVNNVTKKTNKRFESKYVTPFRIHF